jgi:hypothetical protein
MPTIDKSIGSYHDSSNARIRKIAGYTGPNPYNTGGDPFTPASLGMSRIELILFANAISGTTPLYPVWNPDATTGGGKVKWIVASTGVEVAQGVDLSTYFCRFEAIGK